MTETVRLKIVEQQPSIFDRFRRKPDHQVPDFVFHEQAKMRVADKCLDEIRGVFPSLEDQQDVLDLMGSVYKNAEIRKRAYQQGQEE